MPGLTANTTAPNPRFLDYCFSMIRPLPTYLHLSNQLEPDLPILSYSLYSVYVKQFQMLCQGTNQAFWNMASTLFNKCGVIEGYRASRSSHAQTSVSSLALAHVPSQSGGKDIELVGLHACFLAFASTVQIC
ncbi:Uncharacterized protein HZ326_7563 [Fusarium oxysporum f. sp. albedinis]|nr:Uncharacterized protein HZ326_7563 [Fusarium oxysporum f. sp. albedinis]